MAPDRDVKVFAGEDWKCSLLRAAANVHIENFQEPLHRLSPTGENITYTAQSAELWITDGRSLTPAAEVLGTRVPMVAQIHQRNVDAVKSMLASAAARPGFNPIGDAMHHRSRPLPLRARVAGYRTGGKYAALSITFGFRRECLSKGKCAHARGAITAPGTPVRPSRLHRRLPRWYEKCV